MVFFVGLFALVDRLNDTIGLCWGANSLSTRVIAYAVPQSIAQWFSTTHTHTHTHTRHK